MPVVVELAVKTAVGIAQFSATANGFTDKSGCARFWFTKTEAAFVQPFAAVTVTVKFPAVKTVMVGPFSIVDHSKTGEFPVEEAVKFTDETRQFNSGFTGKIEIVGAVWSAVIVAEAVEVQPFPPVTVTVKTPPVEAI